MIWNRGRSDDANASPKSAAEPKPSAEMVRASEPKSHDSPEAADRFAPTDGSSDSLRGFFELIAVMAKDPEYGRMPLSAAYELVRGAMLAKQAVIARGKPAGVDGPDAPIAAALYAMVSDKIDARLTAARQGGAPVRLATRDWRSGEHIWLMALAGPTEAKSHVVGLLEKGPFYGRAWKSIVKASS